MSELAAETAEYVLSLVRERVPHTWRQASRLPGLRCASAASSLRAFADHHVCGVPELAVDGLFLIDAGFPVEVSREVFGPERVLALQAQGWRCVSLLPSEAAVPAPHQGRLDFVLHDLCHLAKFGAPNFHVEQVGFFTSLTKAWSSPNWRSVEAQLDAEWFSDRDHVSSDMNGSSIFLLAVLKMKLRMAARRLTAKIARCLPPKSGPLSAREEQTFRSLFQALLEALELPEGLRCDAIETSTRRDCPLAATRLMQHFHALGSALLSTCPWPAGGGTWLPEASAGMAQAPSAGMAESTNSGMA